MVTRTQWDVPLASFLQQDVSSQTPVWAACTLRDLQAVACASREFCAAVYAWLRGQPRVHIELSDATPALGWYALRRCPSLRVLVVHAPEHSHAEVVEWRVDELRSAARLRLTASARAAMLIAPFVAQNVALERLVLDGLDGSHVEHSRAWLSRLGGRACAPGSCAEREVSFVRCELPATSLVFAGALLKHNDSARSLRACDIGLDAQGIGVLIESLRPGRKLRALALSQNPAVGDGGWAQIVRRVFSPHLPLRALILQANAIGELGARALGELLASTRTLQELDLLGNLLQNTGAVLLADGLRANGSLRILNLRSNRIGDTGAERLGLTLRTNRALRTLLLSWNRIGDRGAAALADGLHANSDLRELNLLENYISDEGARALRDGLATNSTLSCLSLIHI